MAMNTAVVNDPFDAAEDPQVRSNEYWGEVQIDMWFCVLQAGVGKLPFDPQVHDATKRATAIDIQIIPLEETGLTFDPKRGMIAESREWAGIVLPSIKALGISARELNGKFVHVRQKPTGKTYTNKSGEVKDQTTFEFVKVFPDRAACLADYQANNGGAPAQAPAPAPAAPASGNAERDTALKFLAAVVESAARGQTDISIIQRTVAMNIHAMPLINKYFTEDSPETLQLIAEKMAK